MSAASYGEGPDRGWRVIPILGAIALTYLLLWITLSQCS